MIGTNSSIRAIPAPEQHPENVPFWEGSQAGRFMIRRCTACRRSHWYPRPLCPFCLAESHWEAASGRGEVHTFSIIRRPDMQPYCIAYIRLDEDVLMLSNIVDCSLDAIRIGDRVQVVFKAAVDGTMVPMFTVI